MATDHDHPQPPQTPPPRPRGRLTAAAGRHSARRSKSHPCRADVDRRGTFATAKPARSSPLPGGSSVAMRETELFHGQIELLERLASANADSLLASTCASLRWRPLTAVGTVAAPPRRARGSKGLEVPGDRSDPLAGCLPARRAMPA